MAKQLINLGTSANKGDGDPLRTAFDKINDNFTEVYGLLGADEVDTDDVIAPMLVHNNHTNVTVTRDDDADQIIFTVDQAVTDLQGSVYGDDSTLLVDGVNSIIPKAVVESSTNWDTAFSWGDHAAAGYADGTNEANWDTAFSWGDHSTVGYLTTETSHADVVVDGDFASAGIMATDGAGTYSIITDNSADWNTAFSWGDHSTVGYLTSETDSQTLSLVGTDLSITNGNTVDLSGFLTSYTETDPVVGAITGIVKADGAGNISAAVDGIDYLKEETDPVVGAVNGLVKADGAGNISAAVAGTDYLTSVAFADLTATPTTIAGYGITDAFDGTYASLSGSPTALSDFSNDLDYAGIVGGAIQANGLPSGTTFTDTLTLPVLTAEPSSPVNGMVAVADGTSWDPMLNAAQTMVVYLAGAWRQIAQGGV